MFACCRGHKLLEFTYGFKWNFYMAYNFKDDYVLQVEQFSLRNYADENRASFDLYIENRLRGAAPITCLMVSFGLDYISDGHGNNRTIMLESNPYYIEQFESRLQDLKLMKLWNPGMSAHSLVSLVKSDETKDNVRLSAIKELNVIFGITVVDENGRTRAVRKLDDFYREEADMAQDDEELDDEETETDENPSPAEQGDDSEVQAYDCIG